MFLRLCLEVNSRMSSAESIMKCAGQGFTDRVGPQTDQSVWSLSDRSSKGPWNPVQDKFPLEDKAEEKSKENQTIEIMKPR